MITHYAIAILTFFLIAFVVFMVSRWLLKRFGNGYPYVNITAGIISILTTFLAFNEIMFFVILLCMSYRSFYFDRSFDSVRWQAEIVERYVMSKDLVASDTLMSMSRDEVEDLLGESKSHIKANPDSLNTWIYPMGSHSWGFGIKIYNLHLEFRDDTEVSVEQEEIID